MIAIDTNLLVFAQRGNSPDHQAALAALQPVFEGADAWALPWPCLHEFISITTTRTGIGFASAADLISTWGTADWIPMLQNSSNGPPPSTP